MMLMVFWQIEIIVIGFRDMNHVVNVGICKQNSDSPPWAVAALH